VKNLSASTLVLRRLRSEGVPCACGQQEAGGFLDKIAKSSWEGFDGDALTKASHSLDMRQVAAAYNGPLLFKRRREGRIPESIAVASAELVAARFIWKVRSHCAEADHGNLKKRFPAWDVVSAAQMNCTETRLQQLVRLITDVEVSGDKKLLGHESDTESLRPGHWCTIRYLG